LKGKFDAKLSKTAAAWLNVQTMFYSLKGIQKHTFKIVISGSVKLTLFGKKKPRQFHTDKLIINSKAKNRKL